MLGKFRLYAPDRNVVKACLGKTRWASEQAAQRALANLRRENPGAFESTVRPYRCASRSKRGHWHLGHGQ